MSFQSNVLDEVWHINSHNSFHTDAVDELMGEDAEYITVGHLRYIKTKKTSKIMAFFIESSWSRCQAEFNTWKSSYDS